MALRHARVRATAAFTTAVVASVLGVAGPSAHAAVRPVTTQMAPVSMLFPVVGGATYSDTFGAPRSHGGHEGQDLMSPKMRLLVAVFTGTISRVKRGTTAGSNNYVTLRGDNGWTAIYIHMNNDTPGTDDGKGTGSHFVLPGVAQGSRVFAGQQIGWSGDSGNAENTAPHTHFEIVKGEAWTGTVYNPYAALRAGRVLSTPYHSGPHPDGAVLVSPNMGTWVLRAGKRRRVPLATLDAHGWSSSQVISVTADELTSYPSAGWLALPDGAVARDAGGALWVVANGARTAVPRATSPASLGTTESRVLKLSASTLAVTPLAAVTSVPGVIRDGAVLYDTGTKRTWYIDAGRRRRVGSVATRTSWGWSTAERTSVPAGFLDDVPVGATLPLRDGTLFSDPNGVRHVVSNGGRRRVASAVARKAYGWDRLPLLQASQSMTDLLTARVDLP